MNINVRLRSAPPIKLRYQPGATGPSGTITVGTVTTGAPGSSVIISNTGTPENAILNFTIPRGDTGLTGDKGWSPILALVTDGVRRVVQLVDWAGGQGTKPATGSYIGASGLVPDIASAIDIRGPQGPSGSVTDGDKGDIVVSSAGTVWTIDAGVVGTAALADDAVTNAKLATMATARIKGRATAGTGAPEDLTAAQVKTILGTTSAGDAMNTAASAAAQTALLSALVGDSGSGGTKGLAPAPAAGDTAAKKYLGAAGTWSSPIANGSVIGSAYAQYTTQFSITQVIPTDNTIPQSNEGVEVVTVTTTPQFSTSKLRVYAEIESSGSSNSSIMSIMRDSGTDAIAATLVYGTSTYIEPLVCCVEVTAGSTSATTFRMRVGTSTGTSYFNGNSGGALFGGTLGARLIVEEIKA